MTAGQAAANTSIRPRYEVRDATVWLLVLSGLGLCLLLAFTLLGSALLVSYLAAGELYARPVSTTAPNLQRPPLPRLQIAPSRDLDEMRRAEDVVLHSYDWIDRPAGTVRIPIDRAMDVLAAQQLGPHQSSNSAGRRALAPGSR